jgi:hypothetical protein
LSAAGDGADGNGTADRGQRQHGCEGEDFHRMASDFDPRDLRCLENLGRGRLSACDPAHTRAVISAPASSIPRRRLDAGRRGDAGSDVGADRRQYGSGRCRRRISAGAGAPLPCGSGRLRGCCRGVGECTGVYARSRRLCLSASGHPSGSRHVGTTP